jgi:hypothetical protein
VYSKSQPADKGTVSEPRLSPETLRRVAMLFRPEDQELAKDLLQSQCGSNLPFCEKSNMHQLERVRFAALKCSDGDIHALERAVRLAQSDWRDLLVAAGFARDVSAHARWEPKPANEPSEIDPVRLIEGIHNRLAPLLTPLGFERQENDWRRNIEVPQCLQIHQGLTSRTETRFFIRACFESKSLGVRLHLPRLRANVDIFTGEQGYPFRAGASEEALYAATAADINRHAKPWFQRFTSLLELQRGFEDGTFSPHLKVGDQILIW